MFAENRWRAARLLLAALVTLVVPPAAAQDLDAQLKWTEAKVVRYKFAGDFAGKMLILGGEHSIRNGAIIDHVEFEFDWDNQEFAILGTPLLRNSPTKVVAIDSAPIGGCPPPRIEVAPEFASVTGVKAISMLLQIELKQQSGGGALPWIGKDATSSCGTVWDPSSPGDRTFELQLQVIPGMMLAMAPGTTGYDVSKDGKSLLTKPENGWTWTITPSIVR